jgi:hypothetical protein
MGVSVKLALYCELVNVKLKMGVNGWVEAVLLSGWHQWRWLSVRLFNGIFTSVAHVAKPQ